MQRSDQGFTSISTFILLACLAISVSCGDDESPAADAGGDAGADVTADVPADTGQDIAEDLPGVDTDAADVPVDQPELPEASLAVLHAASADGSSVGVFFSYFLDPNSAEEASGYSIVADDSSVAEVVGATILDPAVVVLELDEPLDPERSWLLTVTGVTDVFGAPLIEDQRSHQVMGTVFLNLIWHQHQPSYLDPAQDELQGPWVRKHATKDYFDMTAILAAYPDVHLNVNLTSSLLNQLDLYVERLSPYVDAVANTVDEAGFLSEYAGRTDPWIDLLLNDTPDPSEATDEQLEHYYRNIWSTRSIAEPLLAFFPEYEALVEMDPADYTQLDLMTLKLYFEIAWMDPDFLSGPVVVYETEGGDEVVVDLSDVVVLGDDATYTLNPFYTTDAADDAQRRERGEALANRLVAENTKIMIGVLAIHRELLWDGSEGQVEVLTTPFFHPILPLLYDTDLAAEGQPVDPLPSPAFSYPQDVGVQIATAVEYYTRTFGQPPRGMWPSEGAVAEEVIAGFRDSGIDWIATDRRVLARGLPDASHLVPYRIDVDEVAGNGGDTSDEMMIVFRDTELADKVSFHFQGGNPQENGYEFVSDVLSAASPYGQPEQIITVVADGENAWEHFRLDHDAKGFFHMLYRQLEIWYDLGAIVTVTGSEYIDGNPDRGVTAHPISGLSEYEDLFPGSWIDGTLSTWIGEAEENLAWSYLRTAREDLAAADGLLDIALDSLLDPPTGEAAVAWWRAWLAVYAAEGSDWFWWYGSDQTAAGGDDSPFDEIFRSQLTAMYGFMNQALTASGETPIEVPGFPPVLQPEPVRLDGPFATEPTIDGDFTPDESEWLGPAGAFYDNDTSGADLDPDDDIRRVLYGYAPDGESDDATLFVGIELNDDPSAKLGTDYAVTVYTSHQNIVDGPEGSEVVGDPANSETEEGIEVSFRAGGVARQVRVDFSAPPATVGLANADGAGSWTPVTEHGLALGGPVEGSSLLELAIPLSDLGMSLGDPLELLVVVSEAGTAIDQAPNIGSQVVFADPTTLVEVVFELDLTGDQVALDTFIDILNPPPPAGTGQGSIVGNQNDLANWTPNNVFMADDGVAPDATAGDNIWTRSFLFGPGLDLQYKYTIGSNADEGVWSGTEEYPLTNRGYTVPADGTRRVRVRDVFADRPSPSGSMADLTEVTVEE